MIISQDMFNKIVTLLLLLYAMVMTTLAWYTGKPLDFNDFLVLLTPLLTHMIHLTSNKIVDKGGSNGVPH